VPSLDYRLGIDVGGTNTDAVILDAADRVLAKAKVACTPDITGGIAQAIDAALRAPGVESGRITHVMLGTTHATNAVLERRKLRRVAVIRIGGPATHAIRPMFGWPDDLARAVCVGSAIVGGGIEFDGRDLAPFDADATARFLGEVGRAVDGVAIASVFAPVSPRHELLAAEVVKRELGEVHVSLSHEIGSVGLLERENATILNAALVGVARDVATAMEDALAARDLRPVTFFAQNDGTLMALDHALRYPVLTIGSGPANSIRGAAFLTGSADSLVADVGGTSTDVGVLVNGFPRESSQGVEIGGIRTNFRMPDLVTIALGIIAMSLMYQTLTHYNSATHQVDPELATSWNSSDGGLTWTFQLRHGVYFHTGALMTATAAKASILRTIQENGGAAYIWGAVKTIDTPGPYTLVFHLKYASPLDL
jgi:N-methylhydantoinase A/oxoprolinase/acetone carboxylase beta subunit